MMKLLGRSSLAGLTMVFALGGWAAPEQPEPGLNAETFRGLEVRNLGPGLQSGRIADIALHPENRSLWYVAVGSGGVWKTRNAGTTWTPLFDEQSSYSIGAVALDPQRPDTVWVGTGENVSGRHVGYGDGVYRSLDGGATWENMGLKASEHIGMIRVHPEDSNTVYVAAQGPLWSGGGDRGLYKTTDGGQTWNKILGGGDYTGVSEVHMDPRDPDVLFAVTWQRLRNVAVLLDGGPETAIHKSTDGGATWRKLTHGLPEEVMGKTGLAVSPVDPDVIYATIELARRTGGFWRSTDGGESWEKRNDYLSGGTGPHYYQELFASPHDRDLVYQADVFLHYTPDGGKTFVRMGAQDKHVDHHAVAFDPRDPQYLLVGNDGGLYESLDAGENWRFIENLPVTQFYKVTADNDEPFYNVYGGTQDNNSMGGPSRTDTTNGVRNSDWFVTLRGDGHQSFADPENPDLVYVQWQRGNLNRFDRRTGETVYIKPQPEAGEDAERFNWDAPILISPHDTSRLYFASHRLWRSDDRGDSWRAVSGDLTRDIDRLQEPVMGRRWSFDSPWDMFAMSTYSTITSVAESPQQEGLLYVGTDDGLIQVSEDGGGNWRSIDNLPGVASHFFVNDIKADLHDRDTVYVAVDQHKNGDFAPYLFKSTDRGVTWTSIAGDLPARHLVWRVVQDHEKPELLFAGTEFGLFFTVDGGSRWVELTGNSPTIPWRDVVIQRRESDVVGATFGRGITILDDYSPLRHVTGDTLKNETLLFPVRKAPWYVPRQPLGCEPENCRSDLGSNYYVAPNPPFGAQFTYYLPEALLSRQQRRREAEKPLEAQGKDTLFPGWDAVEAEALEDAPAMVLTVRNAAGEIVRHIEGPATAGFHRVAWDLRYPVTDAWLPPEERAFQWQLPAGVLVAPGTFSVSLARRVDGKLEDLGQSQSFEVYSIREPTLPGSDQARRVEFALAVDELKRRTSGAIKAVEEFGRSTDAIRETLASSNAPPGLYTRTDKLADRATRLLDRLRQNPERDTLGDSGPVPVASRLGFAGSGARSQAYGPTPAQARAFEIADAEFAEISAELGKLMGRDYRQLMRALDAAGVPWTPGRGIPGSGAAPGGKGKAAQREKSATPGDS